MIIRTQSAIYLRSNISYLDIINQLYCQKDKYDVTKSFNQNLPVILNLDNDTIARTQEEKWSI